MFAYGRGARERSEFYWLKASYSASELHPHLPFVLLTHYLLYLNGIGGHTTVYRYSYVGLTFTQGLTSAKQMVLGRRIELLALAWKAKVLPLYEPCVELLIIQHSGTVVNTFW